jgi:hypothetical protein
MSGHADLTFSAKKGCLNGLAHLNRRSMRQCVADTQSLQAAWKATLKVCSEVHQISVRETYINGATGCYRQPVGHLGQVAWVGY